MQPVSKVSKESGKDSGDGILQQQMSALPLTDAKDPGDGILQQQMLALPLTDGTPHFFSFESSLFRFIAHF